MTNRELAKLCYDVTKTEEQPSWDASTQTEKDGALALVEHFLANPDAETSKGKGEIYWSLCKDLSAVDSNDAASVAKAVKKATGKPAEKEAEKVVEKKETVKEKAKPTNKKK